MIIELRWWISILLIICAIGCSKGPDVTNINVDFKLIPFYKELHRIPTDSVEQYLPGLDQKYGNFLRMYSLGVLRIGEPGISGYSENLRTFLEYKPTMEVFDTCVKRFADTGQLEQDIRLAFQHYRYYIPACEIPDVYLHISGFNQSMVVDSGMVGVSIDKYLGRGCTFYEWLGFPVYLRRKMIPEKIVPDIMKSIAMTEYPFNDSVDDVINHLVYEGKITWFVKQMLPDIQDSLLLDYSKDELSWCQDNEEQMWSTMVEQKHLFNTDRMVIQKYTGDAPFTSFFGQNSPGHAGIFVGYKIIESYLSHHPDVTLSQLMQEDDARLILAQSSYRP